MWAGVLGWGYLVGYWGSLLAEGGPRCGAVVGVGGVCGWRGRELRCGMRSQCSGTGSGGAAGGVSGNRRAKGGWIQSEGKLKLR